MKGLFVVAFMFLSTCVSANYPGKEAKLLIDSKETAIKLVIAESSLEKIIGLLGKTGYPGKCLLIPSCNSIHTFFMLFSIDVVFLDVTGKVVLIKENVKPFRFIAPVKEASGVLEFEAGQAKMIGITVGSVVSADSWKK